MLLSHISVNAFHSQQVTCSDVVLLPHFVSAALMPCALIEIDDLSVFIVRQNLKFLPKLN